MVTVDVAGICPAPLPEASLDPLPLACRHPPARGRRDGARTGGDPRSILRGEGRDDRVYVRSAASLTRRLIGPRLERGGMVKQFAVGDHVRWNSEAGYVEGVIIKKHTRDVEYKGYIHHGTESDPQYEIKSDKTDHIAMHKGGALTKL
jgi:hypothetical protein